MNLFHYYCYITYSTFLKLLFELSQHFLRISQRLPNSTLVNTLIYSIKIICLFFRYKNNNIFLYIANNKGVIRGNDIQFYLTRFLLIEWSSINICMLIECYVKLDNMKLDKISFRSY